MCKKNIMLVCMFAVISFADSETPPYLTKCKAADSICILETAKAVVPVFAPGIPELKVPSSDPLTIKSINASEGNLLFVITDAIIIGLKNCEAKKVVRDAAKSKLYISALCTATLHGQYDLKGSVLVLPIEGNGKIHVNLNDCLINIEADLVNKDGEDGKQHWSIKTWTHNFELQGKSKVVFENLYNGNEVLGRAARELMENNSNDIIKEIGPNVIKAVVAKILKHINYFFKALPAEDLSLD